ncbi:MAG: phage shock protein [Methanolobus sp.]|jgi:phage shock protein PspC (stress-responsive transcriptional regulator)|uniref:Putative stress-responsive transcriptional regulator n=1 Tax=Methanolobus tindarius DSM 2278 TaxID=1090322 RepID=W9DYG1_METTI|nr:MULTISPECIES: PspC domain-containing protein [Methanolobus]ETA68742.1 putative stress-responsive transcriptional regulator [Methanolobus tindarius DSM 2278]MDI3486410.1 phage shock protein [Methanolobus sp.]MDK2827043.1 phage shock protein [Methanolobus sp.]MDK2832079.1 phage shock protein [Methanolobus sp.]MDK2940200.1 phage shock protein [Methanolobus sp.]
MYKELRRSKEDRILAGVCSGIGLYTGIDPVLVRLIFAVGTFFSLGTGILIYIIAWIIIPEE